LVPVAMHHIGETLRIARMIQRQLAPADRCGGGDRRLRATGAFVQQILYYRRRGRCREVGSDEAASVQVEREAEPDDAAADDRDLHGHARRTIHSLLYQSPTDRIIFPFVPGLGPWAFSPRT